MTIELLPEVAAGPGPRSGRGRARVDPDLPRPAAPAQRLSRGRARAGGPRAGRRAGHRGGDRWPGQRRPLPRPRSSGCSRRRRSPSARRATCRWCWRPAASARPPSPRRSSSPRRVGIRVMATGGLGGVHRGGERSLDVSADLEELAQAAGRRGLQRRQVDPRPAPHARASGDARRAGGRLCAATSCRVSIPPRPAWHRRVPSGAERRSRRSVPRWSIAHRALGACKAASVVVAAAAGRRRAGTRATVDALHAEAQAAQPGRDGASTGASSPTPASCWPTWRASESRAAPRCGSTALNWRSPTPRLAADPRRAAQPDRVLADKGYDRDRLELA